MAFGRGSMTKEMVGGKKAKSTKKMAIGGMARPMGAGPKMAPTGRGPMGPGAGMAPPPGLAAFQAERATTRGGMGPGAGPTMVSPVRGPMAPPGAGPTMVSPALSPMGPGAGMAGALGGAMGMKKGGKVSASKMNSGGKVNLGDAMKQKVDAMGMKKGGKVGGRGDGIATKGKTKGRMC